MGINQVMQKLPDLKNSSRELIPVKIQVYLTGLIEK